MSEGWRAVRCLATWMAGLLAAGSLFQFAPLPHIDQVSEKLAHVRAGGGESVLFFGSSKIFGGIIPALFDEEMARRGQPCRSFNMGVDAMAMPETALFCERVLALHPPGLSTMVVELGPLRTRIPPGYHGTLRLQYWHDWRRTLLLSRELGHTMRARSAAFSPDPLLLGQSPAALLAEHLSLWARRQVRLGQGSAYLPLWLGLRGTGAEDDPAVVEQGGYRPYRKQMPESERSAWIEMLRSTAGLSVALPSDQLAEDAYRDLQTRARAAGVELVLLTFPNPLPNLSVFPGSPAPGDPPVLAFDSSARFPALYRPENRESAVHLNDTGAQNFTRLLAEQLSALHPRR